MKKAVSIILALFMYFSSVIFISAEEKTNKDQILASLYDADIVEVREAIASKKVTCEELTRYYLYRIQKYDSKFNCFISICSDALDVAKERDKALENGKNKGLLFGVPVVIKDNMDLEGYYTTNGRKTDGLTIADSNASVVNYLLREGAVIIAKTNMSTDAQDARVSTSQIAGETQNAYNALLAAGGSSGGTAVAVSLNFATAGLGTDTNSSLRIPAVLNGCVSLRSTFGLISTKGIKRLNGSRDVAGAITRTVYDQAVMMDVLTQGEYSYTKNLDKNALKGVKIGILSELTYPITNLSEYDKTTLRSQTWSELNDRAKASNYDKEVLTAFENAVKELTACGAEVEIVSMPNLFNVSDKTFNSSDTSLKKKLYKEFEQLLKDYDIDAVIFPTYSSTPLKSGKDANGKYWNAWSQVFINNCRTLSPSASIPEMSVLIGQHSSGAGIGMEIASLKNSEQLLLNLAYSYTQNYDHRVTPKTVPHLNGSLTAELTLDFFEKQDIKNVVATVTQPSSTETTTESTTTTTTTETTTTTTTTTTTETTTVPVENNKDKPNNVVKIVVPVAIAIVTLGVGVGVHIAIKKKKK